jgi:hypothetical protein
MKEPRYCDRCGRSLLPLDVPHVRRQCEECGKTIHLVDRGDGEKGIRVQPGDAFTLPADWLRLSLDPRKSRGRFTRFGAAWFVKTVLTGDIPRDPSKLGRLLDQYEKGSRRGS